MNIHVEVFFSPGCGKCGHAKNLLHKIALEFGADVIQWREVNILEELDYAVALGVLSTPAIAIDKVLVFTHLPSAKRLRSTLLARIQEGAS